ncbi:class I SAM-dependent methyltransferase [Plantactinospora sp. S1510]|uniref:Class I SAM-dependent methyltransferase n=1 Tax=Plantactinospora alkalitolerans TaxID=2789879 RepID=A0ABS0GN00_9ACTN|nr:class I SAM-dependent methyltransferase [Plantactinospora alkalitolerans]MBF9127565.1 class I SAM-dependent methyltransferase [Plantactinospora alkalitolerans]
MDGSSSGSAPRTAEAYGRAANRHRYGDGAEVRRYVADPYHRIRREIAVRMLLDGVAPTHRAAPSGPDGRKPSAGRPPLLELGCGSESMLAEVPDPSWPIVVADLALDALGLARRPSVGILCLDATRPLPLRDRSVGGVLMGELIEHVYDPVAVLRECRRVLAPSGLLVLTTPNLAALQDRVGFLAGRAPRQVNPLHPYLWLHIRPFTVSLLREVLRRADLEPVRVRSNYVGWRLRGGRWVKSRTLARLLPGLGGSLVVAARPR